MRKKLLLLLCAGFLAGSCEKDNPQTAVTNPVDLLPPATQTGEVMLACTVNGKPYICKGYKEVRAYYQWVNGGRTFLVRGLKETDLMWSIECGNLGSREIAEGLTYVLNGDNPGFFGGGYVKGGPDNYLKGGGTDSENTGEMKITRFDLSDELVSGTFWFDLKNPWTGEKIEIRNGRFDTHFSQ